MTEFSLTENEQLKLWPESIEGERVTINRTVAYSPPKDDFYWARKVMRATQAIQAKVRWAIDQSVWKNALLTLCLTVAAGFSMPSTGFAKQWECMVSTLEKSMLVEDTPTSLKFCAIKLISYVLSLEYFLFFTDLERKGKQTRRSEKKVS